MSHETEEIISDDEIDRVHANANFGSCPKRNVVNDTVLQKAFGYHCGHTATIIVQEHGLLGKNGRLTKKGFRYLQSAWSINDMPNWRASS